MVSAPHEPVPTPCWGNQARAAEELFVQRCTLYYRLERLSTILGLDLGDTGTRQRLQLAVRSHDLIRPTAHWRRARAGDDPHFTECAGVA